VELAGLEPGPPGSIQANPPHPMPFALAAFGALRGTKGRESRGERDDR
jgi:hypothetical protein